MLGPCSEHHVQQRTSPQSDNAEPPVRVQDLRSSVSERLEHLVAELGAEPARIQIQRPAEDTGTPASTQARRPPSASARFRAVATTSAKRSASAATTDRPSSVIR